MNVTIDFILHLAQSVNPGCEVGLLNSEGKQFGAIAMQNKLVTATPKQDLRQTGWQLGSKFYPMYTTTRCDSGELIPPKVGK